MRTATPLSLRLGTTHRTAFYLAVVAAIIGVFAALPSLPHARAQDRATTAADTLFPRAQHVLAEFNFTNNVLDSSGNGRNATLIGGTYAATTCGIGLVVGQGSANGIQWNQYASLLVHPYTVEIVLTPQNTTNWSKLFGFDDREDNGWYYKNRGIQAYPNSVIGGGKVLANERHYLAFVSTSPSAVDVYFQGELLGSTSASFTAPPAQAIFFKDDTEVRGEDLRATVDALRISSVSRTPAELRAVQQQIGACRGSKLFLSLLQR